MNAAPFSARLLTNTELPKWHKATPLVRETAKLAAEPLRQGRRRHRPARAAVLDRPPGHGHVHRRVGQPGQRAEVGRVGGEADRRAVAGRGAEILRPIHNWFYVEGRPENNDVPEA
jgi:hypothetical protein